MSFIVRSVKRSDLEALFYLSKQFVLLNLPSDKKLIEKKIELSRKSFKGEVPPEQARYIFVGVDSETGKVAGCSQAVGKKGTEENPNYSFEVLKKEKFSSDLSVGFIHQVLRLRINADGPSEIGGLVVSKEFRGRPEKLGKLISLSRFAYIGMEKQKFSDQIISEMAPPLTDEGRSEFWEALGRRFTGMPYQEADLLSQQNKNFIKNLFPEEDIYTCLLDSKARLVMGRVSVETQPALHMLQSIGFKINNEVDPFDGGPHLEAQTDKISLIDNGKMLSVCAGEGAFDRRALVGNIIGGEFYSSFVPVSVEDEVVKIPEKFIDNLQIAENSKVFVSVLEK